MNIYSNNCFRGIRSVSDAKNLILAGADKIAINTAGIKNPKLIKNLCIKDSEDSLIVSGGLTETSDISSVLSHDSVSGVALGGSLHYKKQTISSLKDNRKIIILTLGIIIIKNLFLQIKDH